MANVMTSDTIGGYNLADKWQSQYQNSGGAYNPRLDPTAVQNALDNGYTWSEINAAGTLGPVTQQQPTKPVTSIDVSSIANVNRDTGAGGGTGLPGSDSGTETVVTKQTTGGGGGGGYRGGYSAPAQAKPAYTAAQLPTATSQADYINAMYDANEQRRRAALEAEYTANVGSLDRQAANIPAQYQNAANAAGAQAAINQAAFNERAAASGLNTGAAGQAALAQNNALLAKMSTIRQNQAQALNDVESQRVSLQTQYQKAIADAIAANEADRAAALYNEAKRVDESLVNTAVNQAAENYRAWQAMYK